MKRLLWICLPFAMSASGCGCDEETVALDPDANAPDAAVAFDGGFDDAGNPIDPPDASVPFDGGFDDAGNPIDPPDASPFDGGFDDTGNPVDPPDASTPFDGGFDDAGNPIDPPDASTSTDGGDPLEQPLSQFCRGGGTVVDVSGDGLCAGDIAAETFQFAICACETIEVQSTLTVDAFDSRLGTYGGGNVSDDGQLGVNDALLMDGKLTVRGSVFVGGDGFSVGSQSHISRNVYAAGPATQVNSSTDIDRNAYFDGDVTGRYNIGDALYVPASATVDPRTAYGSIVRRPIPTVSPCRCANDEILDIPALTAWAATHNDNEVTNVITSTAWQNGTGPGTITLPCGRYYLTRIQHDGSLTIRAEGRAVLFVDGDMLIGGGFNLDLGPEGEVDLFVAGQLAIGAAADFGTSSRPSLVRTYVGGSGTVDLSASAEFGGNLYAPRAVIDFGASANLYGAVFARRALFSGAASVHFDTAVRYAGQACEETPTDGGVADAGPGTDAGGTYDGGFDDAGNPIPAPDAATGGPDAGSTPDATAALDSGAAPTDASGPLDGSPVVDAGVRDTGTPTDTGIRDTGTADTGVRPDSGVVDSGIRPDAGPAQCNTCGECAAPLGCVIPIGQSSGQCGSCQYDLDCCPPYTCVAGACMIQP